MGRSLTGASRIRRSLTVAVLNGAATMNRTATVRERQNRTATVRERQNRTATVRERLNRTATVNERNVGGPDDRRAGTPARRYHYAAGGTATRKPIAGTTEDGDRTPLRGGDAE